MDRGDAVAAAAYALGPSRSPARPPGTSSSTPRSSTSCAGSARSSWQTRPIIGFASWRTRALAALAGVVISALALGRPGVSYGHGLFGWQERGFRMAVAIAVTTEMCAAILLSAALTTAAARRHTH